MNLSDAINYWPILRRFQLEQLTNGKSTSNPIAPPPLIPSQKIAAFLVLDEDDGNDLLVITEDCKVYAYGERNRFGWLGCGHKRPICWSAPIPQGPTEIVELSGRTIVEMISGECHVLALDNQGQVFAWGQNADGQLGNGNTEECLLPNLVKFEETDNQDNPFIVSVKCSYNHNMALDQCGRVYAWGKNQYGQLGLGCSVTKQLTPMIIAELSQNHRVESIACGYWHSLALTDDGLVYAWGRNKYGQVGIGNFDQQTSPIQILPVLADDNSGRILKFKAIACGGWHSLLLTEDSRHIYAFGYNDFRQLGYQTYKNKCCIPIKVNIDQQCRIFHSIAAQHNLSIALYDNQDQTNPRCLVWGVLKNVDQPTVPRLVLETKTSSIDDAFGQYSVAKYTPYLIRIDSNKQKFNETTK